MAHRASEPPEHSAVFESPLARSVEARVAPPIVVASGCRTTREVLAWAIATELGTRCYVAASAADALARLGLDAEGAPLTERHGEVLARPGTMLLEVELLLEAGAGPTLCRALHDLDVDTVILRGTPHRDVVGAERVASTVLEVLRAARARCA